MYNMCLTWPEVEVDAKKFVDGWLELKTDSQQHFEGEDGRATCRLAGYNSARLDNHNNNKLPQAVRRS